MNQGDFGARAFGISRDSARTKIKNIELGRQTPNEEDLKKMALVLGIGIEYLQPITGLNHSLPSETGEGYLLSSEALILFPGLADYIEMLNKAAQLNDHELIVYLAGRLSALFNMTPKKKAAGH